MSSISPGGTDSKPSSFTLKNITIDDNDSSLKYSQGWTRSSSSNAIGGNVQTANGIGDMVQFILPQNAVAIYYVGFQQSGGAVYGACLDCSADGSGALQNFDAHFDAPSATPEVLHSWTDLDPKVLHDFSLVNFPDTGFKGTSTITVDAFVVTVQEAVSAPSMASDTGPAALTAISIPSSSAAPAVPSDTSPISSVLPPPQVTVFETSTTHNAPATPTATRSQNNLDSSAGRFGALRSPVALVAVILVSLFILSISLFALMYFMRRRRRRAKAPFAQIVTPNTLIGSAGNAANGNGNNGTGQGGPAGGTVRVAPGAMVERLVPDRPRPAYDAPPPRQNRRSIMNRLPPIVTQFQPRTAPRTIFTQQQQQQQRPPPQYTSPLRNEVVSNEDPFVVAEKEALKRKGEIIPQSYGAPPPLPPGAGRGRPAEDPFAAAEIEARAQMSQLPVHLIVANRASVMSHYSQAETVHALPTPWLSRPKTDRPWELV